MRYQNRIRWVGTRCNHHWQHSLSWNGLDSSRRLRNSQNEFQERGETGKTSRSCVLEPNKSVEFGKAWAGAIDVHAYPDDEAACKQLLKTEKAG